MARGETLEPNSSPEAACVKVLAVDLACQWEVQRPSSQGSAEEELHPIDINIDEVDFPLNLTYNAYLHTFIALMDSLTFI